MRQVTFLKLVFALAWSE